MEISAVAAIKVVIILSLIIYAVFWGSLALTIFDYGHSKKLTPRVIVLGTITTISGIAMIILSMMLMPSFQWIYGEFGFTLLTGRN